MSFTGSGYPYTHLTHLVSRSAVAVLVSLGLGQLVVWIKMNSFNKLSDDDRSFLLLWSRQCWVSLLENLISMVLDQLISTDFRSSKCFEGKSTDSQFGVGLSGDLVSLEQD